jgi:hypothetical protein
MRLTIFISHSFLSVGGKTYFTAVGLEGPIYVSSDEGVRWTSPATAQGTL